MTNQPELFNQFNQTGKELSIAGQNLALESADKKVEKWSEQCYALLLKYLAERGAGFQFQGEQARMYCEVNKLPEPPSKRAYGPLLRKLASNKLIVRIGYKEVTNYRAHATPSTLWKIV